MSSGENILAEEIESWKGFEYVLREENRIVFHMMLSECIKCWLCECQGWEFGGRCFIFNFNLRAAEND